jgi:hypothetical protein
LLTPRAKATVASVVAVAAGALIAALVATVKAQHYRARTGEGFVFVYVVGLWVIAVVAVAAALVVSAAALHRGAGRQRDQ